ncbi:hypothetical protein DXV75_14630 [Alteromonas aestuariivivens]|uniref:Uncharacterized protein n=1 Tax=Alteromonas aestuariivivens TaxID=1938339 RepID=A0A3D8M3P5_9ALTE|nr:hypothetical protein [Alteromonas aestuariivivens]RDV24251.1 hypothetical protein DXV75_14630 [Alteromonas aestuariivivens]
MSNNNTLLMGQVLQIRDKLLAKRHIVPSSLKSEWQTLIERTATFDPSFTVNHAIKGRACTKPAMFTGSANELMKLVSSLKEMEIKLAAGSRNHH